ncbi:cytochrome-c peroxidase [Ekhidna sp.]|jgi:cytochrome c peroxidase|uniref:cytochrome-c peroxidase n=1 Tax=Ekhidna sp. TaxID=2608089 RepID=UPI0032EF4B05
MSYKLIIALYITTATIISSCSPEEEGPTIPISQDAILVTFKGGIDLENLPNYANQDVPGYIDNDNTTTNHITDGGAVLGRVLFYDKNLSIDNTISCSSCHQQGFAFSDPDPASTGVNGTTGRHSMRLVNARFADEDRFFWNERANSLEEQTTMPIQDHIEMGFSGEAGDEDILDLCDKLEAIDYYNELFTFVYGDNEVTEARMQLALAQFIRSIQSFDSKYDIGRAQVRNNNDNFPNFTDQENAGKALFTQGTDFNNNGVRVGGGLGCNRCHRAPAFDIDPNSGNNGFIASLEGENETDTNVTRSPSLRDLFNPSGTVNGPFMHTGFSENFEDVLDHYDIIPRSNNNIDRRLTPDGNPQNLAMTQEEKEAVIAFIKTLTGSGIYTNEKWSDPFN